MRILMLHNRYGVHARGGAERVVERVVESLTARGHAVAVAMPRRPRIREDRSGLVHTFSVPNLVSVDRLSSLPMPLRAVWHAIDLGNGIGQLSFHRLLDALQPDIVHTHNVVGCGGGVFAAIRAAGIPQVHTLHDVQLLTPSGLYVAGAPATALERSWVGRCFRSFRRLRGGNPAVITGPTEWIIAEHDRWGFFPKSDAAVIGNPIAHERRRTSERRGAVRTLLFAGQLEGHKGVVILLEAYRRLRMDFPDLALHIVGDGRLLAVCKRFAREVRGIAIRGRLDAHGVAMAVEEADLLVVPSLCAENQPSAILEAFSVGLPVIASRVGGIPEMVRDGQTGFLVDPGSVDDLVRAIRAGVEDPTRVRAMAEECRRTAKAHDTETVVEQFLAVYTHAARVAGVSGAS
ncbi:glycosyltransferase [Candidatus Uhrbacteria bacterium]|nr:glycosyltransferase [Candidatus Uhrbacteria bacterium]